MGILNLLMPRKDRMSSEGSSNGFTAEARINDIQAMDRDSYLASDEKEWLRYLSQALRTYRRPGVSLKEEHRQWLAARAQSRALGAVASTKVIRSS
jgi:hypothetical protein